MSDKNYLLLDSRAFFAEEIKDTMILICDTAERCCKSANNGEFGENCVVADMKCEIMWEWFTEESGWKVRIFD